MDGCTDRRMDGRLNGRTDERTHARTDGWTDGYTDSRMNGPLNGRTDVRTNGRTDGRAGKQTDNRTDKLKTIHTSKTCSEVADSEVTVRSAAAQETTATSSQIIMQLNMATIRSCRMDVLDLEKAPRKKKMIRASVDS